MLSRGVWPTPPLTNTTGVGLSVGRRNLLGHAERTVKGHVRVEELAGEAMEQRGVIAGDRDKSDVLADHGSVLRFHQSVVVAVARPRLGLFHQQFVQ